MSNNQWIFVLTMSFTLFMTVKTKIIGHYSLLVTHYSLVVTPYSLLGVQKFNGRDSMNRVSEIFRQKAI